MGLICGNLKCIRYYTVDRGWIYVKSSASEAGIEGFIADILQESAFGQKI